MNLTDHSAQVLYRRLRKELLQTASLHRRSQRHPDLAGDVHLSYLEISRRQLGALRQAYRRRREINAWNHYVRARQSPSARRPS